VDDVELLRRCVDGDPAARDALVRRHVAVLHSAVARVVGPVEAEDVLQATFSKLWEDGRRRLRSFRGGCRLSTWLVAVARREAVDRARSRASRERATASASLLSVLNGHAPAADALAERRETLAALEAALERLPARDRLLVRLVHVDGRTYREAALLLDVPENSISPWLARARTRLEALLRPEPPPRTDPLRAFL
jgi:RNA polymerase sigma-70 factor (ECF subfamily)